MVAPPWYPLPPRGYGGTELVVHLLHTELRRLGHDVTVFGAEGSRTNYPTRPERVRGEERRGVLAGDVLA